MKYQMLFVTKCEMCGDVFTHQDLLKTHSYYCLPRFDPSKTSRGRNKLRLEKRMHRDKNSADRRAGVNNGSLAHKKTKRICIMDYLIEQKFA